VLCQSARSAQFGQRAAHDHSKSGALIAVPAEYRGVGCPAMGIAIVVHDALRCSKLDSVLVASVRRARVQYALSSAVSIAMQLYEHISVVMKGFHCVTYLFREVKPRSI
jgi:hypothetical protein